MQFSSKIRAAHRMHREMSRHSLLYYLQSVVIACHPEPQPFGRVAERWQRELLSPKVPALEYLAGLNPGYWQAPQSRPGNGPLSFMSILARGHDKSSLEGRLLTWLLLASRTRIHGYILAADKDQGALIVQAMLDEARLNPWVAEQLTFTKTTVTGPSGFVEVLPADVGSAFGLRGNIYVADEFTNWPDRGQEMWSAVISGREKISGSLLIVLSNAGVQDSWQHEKRLLAENDDDWVVFERQGQLATWMDRERVDKNRRLLPPSEGDRLYDNKWIDPASAFDYLRRVEVAGCVELSRTLGLLIRMRRDPGVDNYVASIDYGARRDRTALCVLHLDANQRVVVDRLDVWQGDPANPVQIPKVDQWVRDIRKQFNPKVYVVDPSNIEGTVQWMEREGYPVERFKPRGGAGNYEMAQHLRSLIVNRRLVWYPSAGDLLVERYGVTRLESFADELVALRVKKMPYGYRFDHENQKHDDRAVAVGMASLRAVDFPHMTPTKHTGPVLPDPVNSPLSPYNFELGPPIIR